MFRSLMTIIRELYLYLTSNGNLVIFNFFFFSPMNLKYLFAKSSINLDIQI